MLHVTLTFDLLIPKSIGIIYGSWPSMISRRVDLGEISLKLMTLLTPDRQAETDHKRHNIIGPKVTSGI